MLFFELDSTLLWPLEKHPKIDLCHRGMLACDGSTFMFTLD